MADITRLTRTDGEFEARDEAGNSYRVFRRTEHLSCRDREGKVSWTPGVTYLETSEGDVVRQLSETDFLVYRDGAFVRLVKAD